MISDKFHPSTLTWKNVEKYLKGVSDYQSMRKQFVRLLCPDNRIQFPGCNLEIFDKQALWALAHEILYNEDYFFKTDNKTPVIFDLGSNIGLSIYYFKLLHSDSVIHAFEPDPDIYAVLKRNVERNKWKNVTIHNCALHAINGYAEFNKNVQKTLAGSLTSRRVGKETTIPIRVRCKRLSEYIEGPIDYMKIDVEGVEDLVLNDIKDQLNQVDRIFCEFHQGDNLPPDRLMQIISLLQKNNFEYRVAPSVLHNHPYRPMLKVGSACTASIWACRRDILS